MKQRNRKRFDPAFKARVALAAVQERESLTQLGKKFGVHPVLVGQWKKLLLENAATAFTRDQAHEAERTHDELLRLMRLMGLRAWPQAPAPAVLAPSIPASHTCCATGRSFGLIRCGPATSPTSRWSAAGPTWW